MRIVVTEVTDMKSGQICVAGWCAAEKRMIRPLSGQGKHWPDTMANPDMFEVGNVIECDSSNISSDRGPPHEKEDTILSDAPRLVGKVDDNSLVAALELGAKPAVADIFGSCISDDKRTVPAGSNCPSLGGVRIKPWRMRFNTRSKSDGSTQLRCWFADILGVTYELPVVSRSLVSLFRTKGYVAVDSLRENAKKCHTRLGLSHPIEGKAYIMVNNLIFT